MKIPVNKCSFQIEGIRLLRKVHRPGLRGRNCRTSDQRRFPLGPLANDLKAAEGSELILGACVGQHEGFVPAKAGGRAGKSKYDDEEAMVQHQIFSCGSVTATGASKTERETVPVLRHGTTSNR